MCSVLPSRKVRSTQWHAVLLVTTPFMMVGTIVPLTAVAAPSAGRQTGLQASGNFHLASLPLAEALSAYGLQTGVQIAFDSATVSGLRSGNVVGAMTNEHALSVLLAQTGVTWYQTGPTAVSLVKDKADIRLGPVRVGGVHQQTLSQFLDRADTAGSHEYNDNDVTIAGKLPVSVRQVPNSVSVVTQQRILDQNMITVEDALRFSTGVTATPYGDGTAYFMARGYTLDVQYDGMPVVSGIQYTPQFDMMMYDRVEIMRGPTGLLQGSGSGAGSVNLVRKKPEESFAIHAGLQAGSWNNVRPYVDVSTPLNASHTLKARLVVSGQSKDSFVHEVHDSDAMVYGVVEYDINPATTLTVSGSYQHTDDGPFDYGQSRYTNGKFLDATRSGFYGSSWNDSQTDLAEAYVNLTHSFGKSLIWSTSVIDRYSDSSSLYSYMGGGVTPVANTSSYFEASNLNRVNMVGADSNLNYRLRLFGQDQDFIVGTNMYEVDTRSLSGNASGGVHNVFTADLAKPNLPYTAGTDGMTEQWGAYAQARLHPVSKLTIVLGGRVSSYWQNTRTVLPETGSVAGEPGVEGRLTPNAGILYDLTKQITAYFSYSSIFTPQSEVTRNGGGLKPVTGKQYEVGLKGAFLSNRLNASLAAFQLDTNNRAVSDPTDIVYYVSSGKARSRGVEAEVTGNPLRGWNIYAGYTWLETQYLSDPVYGNLSLEPEEPKHSFKLWTTYDFQAGRLQNLRLGGGVRVQSRTSRDYVVYQGAYAVLDLQVGYRLNKHLSATLTLNNATDTHYWARLPTSYFGIYGQPRSVMGAIRADF